jgi:dTMP kinase
MKLSPETARKRAEYGGERYERLEFQEKVAEIYEQLLGSIDNCVEIDAEKDQDLITQEISDKVRDLNLSEPLGTLW